MLLLLVTRTICVICLALINAQADSENTDGLFLTPLIKAGEMDKALAAAEDNTELLHIEPLKSYSGYLTIDDKFNSNLFFWFFPAQEKPESAPLILWVSEFPGFACIRAVFLENGPFFLDTDGKLKNRELSWTKTHSMLYIDAPVGTGFSFADSADALANNSDEEAAEIYLALQQFFTLFKDYRERDFYLAGKSYAGTLIPHIANRIHTENAGTDEGMQMKLKGAIIGTPWIEPLKQSYMADYFFEMGLLNDLEIQVVKSVEDQYHAAIEQNNTALAVEYAKVIYSGENSLLKKFTGFKDFHSALMTDEPAEVTRVAEFIDSKAVHNYLHVGLHKFQTFNPDAEARLATDFIASHIQGLERMLDNGYKVLVYAAQFELQETHQGIWEVVRNLKWKGAKGFSQAKKINWMVEDHIAGYVRQSQGLTYIMIRNAGNYVLTEQPQRTNDMLQRFLFDKGFE